MSTRPDAPLEPLDERLREALVDEQRLLGQDLPSDVSEHLWLRIDTSVAIAAAASASSASTGSHVAGAVRAGLGGGKLIAAIALSFGLGSGVGVLVHSTLAPASAPPVVRVVERIVERAPPPRAEAPPVPLAVPTPTPAIPLEPVHTPPTTPEPERGATSARSEHERASTDGRSERLLLLRAQAALARGRSDDSLAAIEEDARRFPEGEYVEERELLWIQALVASGRNADALRRAHAFEARFPRSILRPAVERAVTSLQQHE